MAFLPALLLLLGGGLVLLKPGWIFSGPDPVPLQETEINDSYDLVVAGGDPEGVAAALSGARNGLQVLLVDTRPVLGGLMTRGWLNTIDMNYGPGGDILNRGIFDEFYRQLRGDSFDVQRAENVFHRMVNQEKNLDILVAAREIAPRVEKNEETNRVTGVVVTGETGARLEIGSAAVIDATQDADLAARAGVPYTVGHEDQGRPGDCMAATLVFRLKGINYVDWFRIYYRLNHDGNPATGANWRSAWGFGDICSGYEPESARVNLRGLNIGRQDDGSVLINALQVFDVNALDEDARQEARALCCRELPRVVSYINRHVPGFKGARLAGTAPELYIRESRHIKGEYRLTVSDVLENRDFYDRVAFGSYPVDIQATGPGSRGYVVGDPEQYAVPLRSLIPVNTSHLLVAGRSASYSSLAAGSARTVPVGMAAGQSAGAAVALARETGHSFREIASSRELMARLQQRLARQGMDLAPSSVKSPEITGHWAYPGLEFMRRLGLAYGGYSNEYGLDREIPEQRFINILSRSIEQTSAGVKASPRFYKEGNEFTIYDASYMFCRYLDQDMSKQEAFDYLDSRGFWDQELLERARRNENVVTSGMAYMMIHDFLQLAGYKKPFAG